MLKITKPTLLLDKSICIRNIERMAAKAQLSGIAFRPHCKTHQSHEIANWFRDFGVSKITVSSSENNLVKHLIINKIKYQLRK